MRFGVVMFLTDETPGPAEVARLAEARGLASLWVPEHTHMPVEHTPFGGGEVPRRYRRLLDPFVALTAAAAVTSRLRLGFGVCLVAQREPLATAKAVATLDLVSGGRVDFGIGAGWNRPEAEHHGVDWDRRFGLMRERTKAMRALWTQEAAAYDGRRVAFAPSWSWPKPVQDPLPVWVGGNREDALRRVVRYGDGWLPNRRGDLAAKVERLGVLAGEAGRPRPPVTYYGARPEEQDVEYLLAAGVDQVLFMLPSAGRGEVEAAADAAAAVAERYA